MNDFDERFEGDALISLSVSDFSEEARLLMAVLYIADRVLKRGPSEEKRIFIFAGHALDSDQALFSSRELADYILQIGRKLKKCSLNTRVIFVPNLSVNQVIELALVPSVDVFEALSYDDWNRSATLSSLEQL